MGGSNQFILLIGAAVAAIVGFRNKVSYTRMIEAVGKFKSQLGRYLYLMVGALAGTFVKWNHPAMIYYGLNSASKYLFTCLALSFARLFPSLLEVAGRPLPQWASRSSALMHWVFQCMVAGAVISGAYFGDKLSPLSDTTNLAPAMAGTDLFTHIRYAAYTTIPSISLR